MVHRVWMQFPQPRLAVLATQLLALGRGESGFEQYRLSAELFRQAKQKQWAGRALLGCASARLAEDQVQESPTWFSRAAEQFEACGDDAGLVQALAGRLQALSELQRWDELGTSRRVVTLTDEDRSPPARAARMIALAYQVQALTAADDLAGAADVAAGAADLAHELGEDELEARLRLGMAHSLHVLERFADAADAYERANTVVGRLTDAAELETQALQGLGTVLRDSPQTGAERLRRLTREYVAAADERMEALCRYELARCLERIRPAQHEECASEFLHAARLFDRSGDIRRAGDCWYRVATAYNWLGLLHPEYRQKCYDACGRAATRFEAAGNMAGKGIVEFMAGQALRKDDPSAPQDPRNLPALRQSVRSFSRAGWEVAVTGSRLAVAAELGQVGRHDAWMASALLALRSYESARAGLLIPQHRRRHDRQVIHGLQIMANYLWQFRKRMGRTRRWAELAWRLEQAAKGRSFLDEHHQDEVWNSLIASDQILRELTSKIEQLTLRRDELTRAIDAALVTGQLDEKVRAQADLRNSMTSDLENVQRQLDRHVEQVVRERPDQAALASVSPVTPPELQACLDPSEAYLGYLWNGGSVIRSLVTPSNVSIQPVGSGILDYARSAVAAAGNGEMPPDTSPDIVECLLGQIPPSTDTLIISPDGLLNGFPWHLISLRGPADTSHLLGDRYSTAVIPTAGILPRLRSRNDNRAVERVADYLGVACDGAAAGAGLTCVDGEVEAIARSYFADDPGSGFLATADCHAFLERGCRVGLLHLACHANRNGLMLSRDGTWVTPVGLIGLRLRADILLLTAAARATSPGRTTTSSSAWCGNSSSPPEQGRPS